MSLSQFPVALLFGALCLHPKLFASPSSSDLTLITPGKSQRISLSSDITSTHSGLTPPRAKRFNVAEMNRQAKKVKASAPHPSLPSHGSAAPVISSTKAFIRTGLLNEARRQNQSGSQRRERERLSDQIARSGRNVDTLLSQLTQRPLQHDRYLRTRQIALNTLMAQLGKPYLWGDISISGFDCSGLIYFAYKDHIKHPMPRTAKGMFHLNEAKRVHLSELEPGDLVFFQIRQAYVDHVGVYLGNNQFIQSPRTGLDIRISQLNDNYWQNHYVGARRLMTPDNIR